MNRYRPGTSGTVLDKIVSARAEEIDRKLCVVSFDAVRESAEKAGSTLDFHGALSKPRISLIAEMKRASPSGGELRPDLDPAEMAQTYAAAGASAMSVLTEPLFFNGRMGDLRVAKAAAPEIPALQKDFVFDEYQVYEARANNADAVLLIVAILDPEQLNALHTLARDLGMAVIVEVFDHPELETALKIDPPIVGVNNRNLKTLETSLAIFEQIATLVPTSTTLVAESGMKNADDVRRVASLGADAVLIGEALMRAGTGVAGLARAIAEGGDGDS
jgi:indole-3-glycerol phosphate synthase